MSIEQIFGLAAALITILGSLYALWRFIGKKFVFYHLQEMDKPVEKSKLTYEDAHLGIEKIASFAERFQPDLIVGINRGGAIIGGIVAKKLSMHRIVLIHIDMKEDEPVHLQDTFLIERENISKVLVLDDAFRFGVHMFEAKKYIEDRMPNVELVKAALLSMDVEFTGGSPRAQQRISLDAWGFHTKSTTVKLPWDE